MGNIRYISGHRHPVDPENMDQDACCGCQSEHDHKKPVADMGELEFYIFSLQSPDNRYSKAKEQSYRRIIPKQPLRMPDGIYIFGLEPLKVNHDHNKHNGVS